MQQASHDLKDVNNTSFYRNHQQGLCYSKADIAACTNNK